METPLLDFLGRRAGYSSFSRSSSQSLSCFKPSSCFKSALCFLKKSTLVYFAKPASVNTWLWTSSACPPCPRVGELAEDFYARVMTRLISARLQHVDGQMRNLAARRRHARHRPLSRLAEQPLQVPAQAPFPVAHDRHRNSFPNGIASLSKGCAPQTLDPGQTDAVAGPSPSCGVIALARVVVQLLADLAGLVVLLLRPGRPSIPLELRQLIRRMASENPLWGEERIANELPLKLGLRVSARTVRKCMPMREVVGSDRAHQHLSRGWRSGNMAGPAARGPRGPFSRCATLSRTRRPPPAAPPRAAARVP